MEEKLLIVSERQLDLGSRLLKANQVLDNIIDQYISRINHASTGMAVAHREFTLLYA